MKLTLLEKMIVGAVCFRGEISVPVLARELKQREHKVRYAFDRLIETRVLQPHFYLCPSALGFSEYQIFVSLAKHGAAARERFISAVKECGQVSWFGAVGGPFEFDIMLCTRGVQDVSDFIDQLCGAPVKADYHKVVALQLTMTYFAPKYLGINRFAAASLTYGARSQTHTLDELDRRILSALIQSGGLPYSQLARHLEVPLTTFMYRLRTLKEHGIITGVGYFINPFALGVHPYLFLVRLTGTNQSLRKSLAAFCAKHPNITYLIDNLGSWDYQVGARFEDPRHVPLFIDEFQQRFESILGELTCLPVFEPLRSEWNPFGALKPERKHGLG